MVNYLSDNVSIGVVLYADDTTIINRHNKRILALASYRRNQSNVQNWLNANELILNEDKTFPVFLAPKKRPTFLGFSLDPK